MFQYATYLLARSFQNHQSMGNQSIRRAHVQSQIHINVHELQSDSVLTFHHWQ